MWDFVEDVSDDSLGTGFFFDPAVGPIECSLSSESSEGGGDPYGDVVWVSWENNHIVSCSQRVEDWFDLEVELPELFSPCSDEPVWLKVF